ncbi:Multidrug resistance protein ABC Superfamily [Phytophthora palmivora]|uniref:Multidrug resistance protein ABC Superfamily n=1 Tax=Phytophthora palmivora TaxID=4796 RepID=A0A2P4X3Z9_9STRA|nr:Multidrug resistance protein ABC Superfamily [Phytophthora palmivora]
MSFKGVPVNWNGEHWDFYKALMMSLFEENDLEEIATGKAKEPDRVMRKVSGTEMWKTLEEMFEAPRNRTLFVHQLRHTRANRADDIVLHLGKMYDIRDRLATMKYAVHDVDMIDALLNSGFDGSREQKPYHLLSSTWEC